MPPVSFPVVVNSQVILSACLSLFQGVCTDQIVCIREEVQSQAMGGTGDEWCFTFIIALEQMLWKLFSGSE